MSRLNAALAIAGLLLPGCEDSVSGFLSCGIEVCTARQRCVDAASGPACVCAEGFEGANCERCSSGYARVSDYRCELIPIDCASNPGVCGLHGACVASASGDVCDCDELYGGRLCELCAGGYQDNDSDGVCRPTCALSGLECKSPSRCSDARGTAVCDCPTGYTGDDCSRCALGYRDTGTSCAPTCAAASLVCGVNQVCVDSANGARCACAEGYAGSECRACAQGFRLDVSTGSCLPSCEGAADTCGAHGRCDESAGFARCVCRLGYSGESCEACADHFSPAANGACERRPGGAETLVAGASYASRAVVATIDPNSGLALPLAELSASGIARGPDAQTLFLNQSGRIGIFSLPTGAVEETVAGSGAGGPLTWDPALKRLYAIGAEPPFRLLSIDPVAKVVVELFDTNLAGVADLALDAGRNRLLALRDALYELSLLDGAVTRLGAVPPATVGVAVSPEGTLFALSATDGGEAATRVQACRATAQRLGIAGFAGATGRFMEPAPQAASVSLEAATSDGLEVLAYLGRDGSGPRRGLEISVQNPQAFVCLALEEATLVTVPADARFRALVAYAADAAVELAIDPSFEGASSPSIFLGGYAASFAHPERDDILAYTRQEWSALRLPIDTRFHQPGPGVLHTLDADLAIAASTTLSGSLIPSGLLAPWAPAAP
jgi:hypothetical protein